MGCLLVLMGLFVPRVAIMVIWLFTGWLGDVFSTWIWPVLGFLFMPYTTLAYTAAVLNTGGAVRPGWLILIILAALVDMGHWGGGYRAHRKKAVVRRR